MRIEINNLRKAFQDKIAVEIDHFSIADGELLGLVGNNGAGKTTLFRLMLDLLKADNGDVLMTFNGLYDERKGTDDAANQTELVINPTKNEEWKRFTGAYIDEGFLIDFLTPEEYFDFIGRVCGLKKQDIKARIELFEQFMGGEIVGQKKYIRDLSAGNKQKVGIIAAMFGQPQLLILDEPFNFLDPSSQNILKKILVDYIAENHSTVLISSHNLQHTVDISTRIALLEKGRIISDIPNENGSARTELESYFAV